MALVCISSSSKKNGKGPTNDNPPVKIDTKRQGNWSVKETDTFLEVVRQVQSENGQNGFSFKAADWSRIYTLFKTKIPGTTREKSKLQNRIKVLQERFKVCHELVDRSGGGWDADKKRLAAPSEEDYKEMVKTKGPKANFLLEGTFEWYPEMLPMVGGQTSRGNVSKYTWNSGGEGSSQQLPLTHRITQASEQGSSDDPEEFPDDNEDFSSPLRGSFFESTYPTSQSSGSKRKSTDNSAGEGNSKKKKKKGTIYRERHNRKAKELDKLFKAGLEIADSIKSDTAQVREQVQEGRNEIDRCLARIQEFQIKGPSLHFLMAEIEKPIFKAWFLKDTTTKQSVIDYLNGVDVFGNKEHAQRNPSGYSAMLTRHQGMPTYPNYPEYGGNNYGYPPPPHHPNY